MEENKVYILEDYSDGHYFVFKTWDRAFREMLEWYVKDGFDDILVGFKDDLKKNHPDIDWDTNPCLERFASQIKDDLTHAVRDGYVESFAYINSAEVKD